MSTSIPKSEVALLVGGTAAAIGLFALHKYWQSKKWHQIGHVTSLAVHPMKSGRPVHVSEAISTNEGLKLSNGIVDRHLLIINSADGKLVTARIVPRTMLVAIELNNNVLTLSMPTAPESIKPIDINLAEVMNANVKRRCLLWEDQDIDAIDCGDDIAQWIGANVTQDNSMNYRLVYRPFASQLYNARDPGARMSEFIRHDKSTAFQDLTPYMLATVPSLCELNSRLDHDAPMQQFRPNITVNGSFEPWSEDAWHEIRIGDHLVFESVKPCTRCVMTTIDVDKAERSADGEPLKTLRSYRQVDKNDPWRKYCRDSPRFGINLLRNNSAKEEHPIQAGMPVSGKEQ